MAHRLADRFDLRPQDRDDLEQELWLALLVRWSAAARSTCRELEASPCAAPEQFTEAGLRRLVARDVDQVAASLLRRHPLSIREHPLLLRIQRTPVAQAGDESRRRELRLDLAAVLSRLPGELRELCHRVLSGEMEGTSAYDVDAGREEAERQLMTLRHAFRAYDLRGYL